MSRYPLLPETGPMMTDDDSPSTPSGAQSPAPAMAPQVQTTAAVQADFAAGPGRAVPAVAGGVTSVVVPPDGVGVGG